MAPLAAGEHLLGNLFHSEVGIALGAAIGDTESGAEHEQCAIRPHFVAKLRELISAQVLRSHVDEVALCGMAVLPI